MFKSDEEKKLADLYQEILNEDMGAAGVVGAGMIDMGLVNIDSYAPGDARNPFGLGITSRKGKVKRKNSFNKMLAKKKKKIVAKNA